MSELENLLEIERDGPRPQQPLRSEAVSLAQPALASSGGGIAYNPGVIQGYARHLYSRAAATDFICTVLWTALLGGAGAALDDALRSGGAGILVGGLLGGFLGFALGNMKASAMRLEAQVALRQVEIERNTRK
jgi:hypothetical protein